MLATDPVFVLGAARSGTTLMRFALDTHPRIAVPCEWNFTVPIVRAYAHFASDVADHPDESSTSPFAKLGIEQSYEEVRARFRSQFESWYVDYAARFGKARWGATTHCLLDRSVDVLDNLLDGGAVYIVIVRHPIDQATSAIERFYGGVFDQDNLEKRLQYWTETVTHHLQVEEELEERCTRIRYEELVRNPQERFDAVFDFLQESPIPGIERKMFAQAHDGSYGDHKIGRTSHVQKSSVGRWRKNFDITIVEAALEKNSAARSLMAELGYTL